MSTLSSYIASKYLSASTPSSYHNAESENPDRPKKRRKKDRHANTTNTLVVADDDDLQISRSNENADEDGAGGGANVYEGKVKTTEFRKKKGGSGWNDITASAGAVGITGAGDEEADKLIQDAVNRDEERRRQVEMEEGPAVVDDFMGDVGIRDGHDDAVRMESGVKAGLQTAADTARLAEKEEKERRAEEKRRRREAKEKGTSITTAPEEETIYRDASGRRIDVNAKRLEARQKEKEEEVRKKRDKEEAMGEVQRRQREEKKQDLEEAKFMTLARGEDDEEMNRRMREVVRWDDPMAGYMAEKAAEDAGPDVGRGGSGSGSVVVGGGKGKVGKRAYQGHAPPNRYGIAPGWRWDGVDRSNGFEKEWFQARSNKARKEDLSYQWQEDE